MKTKGETVTIKRIPSQEELDKWNGDFVPEMYANVGQSGEVIFVDEDSSNVRINGSMWWYPNICFENKEY